MPLHLERDAILRFYDEAWRKAQEQARLEVAAALTNRHGPADSHCRRMTSTYGKRVASWRLSGIRSTLTGKRPTEECVLDGARTDQERWSIP